ncbi:uncharacterized protein CIMG_04723 [Coccidioides immitis RS]|uniref:Uncharacterized protein n=1 Tax=Coccidioides immitis (strain RS) TaxID=246410 RepID=J3KE33_COCIM|nr:uncharacterized protein CIMG_04723 [Coccidioides immitis RS]EAS33699.3 hypothetical protein CIMG_04723 [Coccidioides immitis RS]
MSMSVFPLLKRNVSSLFRWGQKAIGTTGRSDISRVSEKVGNDIQSPPGLASYHRGRNAVLIMAQNSIVPSKHPQSKHCSLCQLKTIESAEDWMKNWVFEEKGVLVSCYVWSVMAMCGALVFGVSQSESRSAIKSPSLTLSISRRTTGCLLHLFYWSLRASEWANGPGETFSTVAFSAVVSRSSIMIRVEEQLMPAKVFQEEQYTFLKTHDGFSIYVPMTLQTMLFSGLVMIQVRSLGKNGVICLDVQEWSEYTCSSQLNPLPEESKYISSTQIPGVDSQGAGLQRTVLKLY